MTRVERRQTERKTLEMQTYINIEPNNVGIVLNVSAGGLCFHSIDPVKHNGTIRFGLSGQKQRVEAEGVLVWSDETQRAGVRFTSLSAVARDKVRNWLSQSATLPQPMASAAQSTRNTEPVGDRPAPLFVDSPRRRPRMRLSGFSSGLATGLLISVFVTAGFIFHGYRHEFGEWLIRTGERFAGKSQAHSVAVAAPAEIVLPASTPTASPARKVVPLPEQKVVPAPRKESVARASAPVPQAEKVRPQPEPTASQVSAASAKPQVAKLEPAKLVAAAPNSAADPGPKVDTTPASTTAPLRPAATSAPTTPVVLASTAAKLETTPRPAPASTLDVRSAESKSTNSLSTLEVFFEVGKFKNPLLAHDEADKVARLGFPAAAVHKHFLWSNSYQVLVGPYNDEERAKTTHDTLVSKGFDPQTFEKGSRSLTLASTLSTEGGSAPEGDYVISWESYIGNASVKFLRNNLLVAKANARWEKRDAKYRWDSYVYRKNPDGSRTLLEIHFGGMRQALVFGRAS
jgi:hypothetical protein